jgi:hypothetical protein
MLALPGQQGALVPAVQGVCLTSQRGLYPWAPGRPAYIPSGLPGCVSDQPGRPPLYGMLIGLTTWVSGQELPNLVNTPS